MGKDKKKKPIGVRIALGLGIPLVIIGLLIGSVFIVFGDRNDTKFVGNDNYTTTQVFNNAVVKSLGNTETLKKMDLVLDEGDINQILYNVSKDSFPEEAKQYLKKLYVEFNDEGVNFCLNAEAIGFKTRLVISTKIASGQVDGKKAILFNIDKISIGMVDFYGILMKFNIVNDGMLESLFKSTGFSFKSDLANKRLYYLEESLNDDMSRLIGGGTSLVGSLLSHFQAAGLVNVSCDKNGFGAKINLETLQTNSTYIGSEVNKDIVDIDTEDIKAKVFSLLTAHIVDVSDVSIVYGYLINGYSSLNEENKEYIDSLDLTSIGILVNNLYEGYSHYVEEEDKIENIVANEIALSVPTCITNPGVENKIISISEYDIDNYLASTSLVGTTYALASKSMTGIYNTCYITLDNLYCNIIKDHIYYVVGININGLDTRLIVDTKIDTFAEEAYKLKFTIDKIYYGETLSSEKLTSTILDMMGDAINNIGEWVTFSPSTGVFEISVQDIVYSNPTYGVLLRDLGESRTVLSDVSLDEEGTIDIFFKADI